ncbi:MAG: DUF6443 domain-containing protein, partial [Bacteroidota bacterium]
SQVVTTWDENGNFTGTSGGSAFNNLTWHETSRIEDYQNGLPREVYFRSWTSYDWLYTWDNTTHTLQQKQFGQFLTETDFYPGTELPRRITAPDGNYSEYAFDRLGRLTGRYGKPKSFTTNPTGNAPAVNDFHVTEAFTYDYLEGITHPSGGFVKSTTNFTPVDRSALHQLTNFSYVDGLGRQLENVRQGYGPNQEDVVSLVQYDQYGRMVKEFEPYAPTTPGPASNPFVTPSLIHPTFHTRTAFNDSPLNRPAKVWAPDWTPAHNLYGTNDQTITVPGTSVSYPPNSLSVTTQVDPGVGEPATGHRSLSFVDKKGREILRRRLATGGATNDTYYLYDGKDRVTTVIPPGATATDAGLIYTYRYDGRDRVVEKKIPDAAPMYYRYDERDLLTYSQDGNQRAVGEWLHTQYDDYGRVTRTGLVAAGTDPDGDATVNLPDPDCLIRNEYDDPTVKLTGDNPDVHVGKLSFTHTGVLDGSASPTTRGYKYDLYGRIIRDSTTTILSTDATHGFNRVVTKFDYDFADNQLGVEYEYQKNDDEKWPVFHRQYYDHSGRLIKNTLDLPPDGKREYVLCEIDYTIKDQVAVKRIDRSYTDNPAFQ